MAKHPLEMLATYMDDSRGAPDIRVLWVSNGGDGTGAWYVELHGEKAAEHHYLDTALSNALEEWKRWEEADELP